MWNTIAWIAVGSAVVASLMELIKFKIYDDKATKVKMTLLGLLFSGVLSPVLYFGFTLLGTPDMGSLQTTNPPMQKSVTST